MILIPLWRRIRASLWCRHEWWSIDEHSELWGDYEFIHCRKCDDWFFAKE